MKVKDLPAAPIEPSMAAGLLALKKKMSMNSLPPGWDRGRRNLQRGLCSWIWIVLCAHASQTHKSLSLLVEELWALDCLVEGQPEKPLFYTERTSISERRDAGAGKEPDAVGFPWAAWYKSVRLGTMSIWTSDAFWGKLSEAGYWW